MHLQMTKRYKRKKKKHNPICYINSFATLFQIYIYKYLQKTVISLKFNMNANTYEKF